MIDLHMHTTYSDGACQPEELVQLAIDHGLEAIAVTDHDSTLSLPFVMEAAKGKNLEIIPGIEINTVWKGQEVHVLGYYIDPNHEGLKAVIEKHAQSRVKQIQQMASLLRSKARLNITYEDILSHSREQGTLGRPHVAQAIVSKGGARTISEAFQKYLNSSSATFVRRETVSPHEAVEAIYESGGIPVIAHPGEMVIIEELVLDLMNYGLRGLEAYHRSHSPVLIEFHCSLAEKYGLIVTGGTDFHGLPPVYPNSLSRLCMPAYVYDELKKEHQRLGMSAFKAS